MREPANLGEARYEIDTTIFPPKKLGDLIAKVDRSVVNEIEAS